MTAATSALDEASQQGRLVELVGRAQQMDEAAARDLFDLYNNRVMGFCMLSTNDRDVASDITQEIFIKVFRGLPKLEAADRFGPWLWTIAKRECASFGKKQSRYTEIFDLFSLDHDVLVASEDKDERERRIVLVHTVLTQIDDDKVREIVLLKYTEPEHTTREIAEKLSIPHGTVTVNLMRFRNAIKRRLAAELARVDLEAA